MLYLLWLLPVLTSILLFIVYRDVMTYKVGAGFTILCIIYSLSHSAIIKGGLTEDTEWWGNYATSVHYYDDWDEEVPCRHPVYCTRSYECGDSKQSRTCTEEYICGYVHAYDVDYHSEYWSMRWDNNQESHISKSDYIYWCTLWANKFYKVELNRDYHSNDGDDVACDWDLRPESSQSLITEHTYVNKVQASNSVFKADKVDSTDVAQYHLFEYPKVTSASQPIILGSVKLDQGTNKLLEYINGYYGSKKQFKLIICAWRNQSEVTAERQHSYWENLNKNEFLVCLGLDNSNQIQWVKSYSWMDKPLLSVKVDQWFNEHRSLNLHRFASWLPSNIEEFWQRKHFKDFDYLQIEITQSQYTVIFIVVFIFCIIQALVTNYFIKQEGHYKQRW